MGTREKAKRARAKDVSEEDPWWGWPWISRRRRRVGAGDLGTGRRWGTSVKGGAECRRRWKVESVLCSVRKAPIRAIFYIVMLTKELISRVENFTN